MDHKNKTQTNVNMYSDTVLTQAQKTVIEQTTTKTPEINRITNSSNKTTTETIKLKTIKPFLKLFLFLNNRKFYLK